MYPNPQDALPLPPRPNAQQYRKRAKELVKAGKSGDSEAIRVVKSMREPIRLAAGLDASGNLTGPAMGSALACLRNFRDALAGYRLEAVRVVATSTLRVARNAASFLPAEQTQVGGSRPHL